MKVLSIFFLLAALTACASTPENNASGISELIYSTSKLKLSIPNNYVKMAMLGGSEKVFVIKYGDKVAKDYLTVSREVSIEEYGCDIHQFYNAVLEKTQTNCDKEAVIIVRNSFEYIPEIDKWSNDQFTFYYTRIKGHASSIMILGKNNETFRIESDFMTKEQMKALVTH